MKYIECPNEIDLNNKIALFLAGGITSCPVWQDYVVEKLAEIKNNDFVVLNPRRKNFDVTDSNMNKAQIAWEYKYLNLRDRFTFITELFFWFPKETLCPITLFEYGKALGQNRKQILVGCDLEYKRLEDIKTQTKLANPYTKVHTSLDIMISFALCKYSYLD